jgi:glutathione S-transferase
MASPIDWQLYTLSVSPWSERARWVLEHHRLPYRKIEHVPMLGERRLRRVLGNPRARATVPVLVAGEQVLRDSWEIALYAERVGQGTPLIGDAAEQVRHWHDLAERAMSAGRALVIDRSLASEEALDEALAAPAVLRPLLRPLARQGMRWFARKYQLDLAGSSAAGQALRTAFDELRAALRKQASAAGVGDYLLGRFSYADIIAATMLQGVSPVAHRYIPLGPATRRVWTNAELAADYADLIAWRDRLYERHRGGTPERSASGSAA